ncbi:MAG: PQQ-dependent sugar dehydrogenase [Enhygromyxa sp.]
MADDEAGTEGGSEESGEPEEPEPEGDDPLPPLGPRPDTRSCRLDGTAADALPRLEAVIVEGPSFAEAAQILAAPDAGLWVVEAGGRIWSIDPAQGEPPSLVLDVGDRVDCCSSRGLLAAALGPGPELFIHYHRATTPERTRVARLSFDAEAGIADPDSEQVVLEVNHAGVAASGGALAFDKDGMLLVGIGDDSVAPPANPHDSPARDLADLRGSVLRLEVGGGGPGYAIPADNPFVGHPGARPELFAIGLHDPRTCATDLETGRTWCSDKGSGLREELDALIPGADFGWPIVEGFTCTLGECEPTLFAGPHADYGLADPDAGLEHCELRSGIGYRGAARPELQGVQLFGDRCSGRTFGLSVQVGPGAVEIVAAVAGGIAAIGPDHAGEPWIVDGEGRLARLELAEGGLPGTLPAALSQTGCFPELPASSPAPDLVPFLVASALWSDALLKDRYMVVPPGERIKVRTDGRWLFPEGSLLIKTFTLEARPDQPDSRRPIETRFMVRRNGTWEFHSYRWTEDGSDALLLDDDETVRLRVEDPEGAHEFEWTFPDRIACRTCHGFTGGRPLGPNTPQLNREVRYGEGALESQLAALTQLELLEFEAGLAPDPAGLPRLTDPRDLDAPLEHRARAYFEANCAHCHRPAWMRPDLRAETPLAQTGLCDAVEFPSPWVMGNVRVLPGAPEQSNLWLRMGTRGKGQMPPLGTALVDPLGHALIGEWIEQLQGCE